MDIQQALQQASQNLEQSSASPQLDAQILLSHLLHCNSAYLMTWPEKQLDHTQQSDYRQLIQQRQQGLPVAHLTGLREFWSLEFCINNSTLIPRPETETLIEFILQKFGARKTIKLLDLGTGSGAIAISIASEKPQWNIFASERSTQALQLARHNSQVHQTDNVRFIQSDWFNDITPSDFDIIVSNPPYIATNDPHLVTGDVRFEPQSALTSGQHGMDDIEHICQHAGQYLNDGAWLIVEHGYNQKQAVADCFTKNGFSDIEQQQDLSGHVRMTAGHI